MTAKVRSELAEHGRAKVILSLRDGMADDAPEADLAQGVAAVQDEVLAAVGPVDFELTWRPVLLASLAGTLTPEGLARLERDPRIRSVEFDEPVRPFLKESVPLIGAEYVQDVLGYTGKGVTVAVLDTGIDSHHPDLADHIVDQHCFSSSRSCPPNNVAKSDSAEDEAGHGTMVSGIIASRGVLAHKGVAPGANILAVRVFRDEGGAQTSDIIEGLDWTLTKAATHNVKVVNMSLGGGSSRGNNCDNQETNTKLAFQRLVARGIAIFVATGNDGLTDAVSSPACISNSIAVGATYDAKFETVQYCPGQKNVSPSDITCFTNRGRAMDLLAPGYWITTSAMGGKVASGAGTSFAAPMAAGVAALMFEANPDLRPSDVERILKDTGDPIKHPETGEIFSGVNARKAVEAVMPTVPTAVPTATLGTATPTHTPGAASPSPTPVSAPPTPRPTPTAGSPAPTSTSATATVSATTVTPITPPETPHPGPPTETETPTIETTPTGTVKPFPTPPSPSTTPTVAAPPSRTPLPGWRVFLPILRREQ